MLILHVDYTVRPKQKEAFVAAVAAADIDTASRAEKGCIQYDYFYGAQTEDQVLLVEVWENEAAQKVHTHTAHFQQLAAIKEQFVLETDIKKYTWGE